MRILLMISALLLTPALAAAKGSPAENVLDALAHVAPADRLMIAGAGLEELGGWKYGADLVPAFQVIRTSFDKMQRKMVVLRALQMPLALGGCARAVAGAISLVPAQQGEFVRAHCPPAAPLFTAARTANAPLELVSLAVLLEQRAQKGGYAAEPLHRAVVDALLAAR